jgi:hypothetical protein
MSEPTAQPGCYVYGVARDVAPATQAGLTGVAGAPVRVVPHQGLSALVSAVDLAEFGEDGLRRNLENLDWLEATARAHHAVLAACGADHPVVPLRLATVYHDEERVRGVLAERAAAFDAALRRVEGCVEWGLKAFLDQAPRTAAASADPAPDADPAPEAAPARPGTAYLLRRQARRHGAEHQRQRAEQRIEAVHTALSAVAADARRYPPQDSRLSGDSREMLLNAAYLVRGTERASLEQALNEVDTGALVLEWTGPWVPYSFAVLEPEQ